MTGKTSRPLISVIIPVYNCAEFLDECLESVCSQSLQDIEIILIDDGSSDKSPELIDEWAKRHKRIHTLRQPENQGVSIARNLGLDQAQGEYIIFLDADDYWTGENMLAELYDQARADDADLLRFGFRKRGEHDEVLFTKVNERPDRVDLTARSDWNVSYSSWALLVRRELIEQNNLRFEPGLSMGEDALFNTGLYCHARLLVISNKAYYNYRRNPDSANCVRWSPDKLSCTVWWFELAIKVIKESPAYARRPDLLQTLCRERLNMLNRQLGRLALNIFNEEQLNEFVSRWTRCLSEITDVDSLPEVQQQLLAVLSQQNTAAFREYIGSTLAQVTLNRQQAGQLGRLLLNQQNDQITVDLGGGRLLSLPKAKAHSLAHQLLTTKKDQFVLKL